MGILLTFGRSQNHEDVPESYRISPLAISFRGRSSAVFLARKAAHLYFVQKLKAGIWPHHEQGQQHLPLEIFAAISWRG
jgi:hypothetical protein